MLELIGIVGVVWFL